MPICVFSYFVRNVVYRHHRYQPAAVHLEERVAQCAFQLLQRDLLSHNTILSIPFLWNL